MNIVVCVKQVNGELNPFDACALECALQMNSTNITVISMGRPDTADMLKKLTLLGVHRAILLTDPLLAGSDTLATSYVLSLAIQKLQPDLILCGRQSIDGETAQVGPCLATLLHIPVITNALTMELTEKDIFCITRGGNEQSALPAVITVERINRLRFPSIRSIAKKVELWTASDIGADESRCGLKGSPTRVLKTFENIHGKRKCRLIPPSSLRNVIEDARNKPQLKEVIPVYKNKLQNVFTVGDKAAAVAAQISDNVTVIPLRSAEEIATIAIEQKPSVILWSNDLWGRKTAPQVAALLQTGLCADCTQLETNGTELFMYRPALGGNVLAKIQCLTSPVMATVRILETQCAQIIVSGGKGARHCLPELHRFSSLLGADFGASRGLVDLGLAAYENQIGLTGITVSPKLYIACGIRGNIQHVCGMDQAQTVIAINTDKDAPIFDYADYGIIGDIKDVLRNF